MPKIQYDKRSKRYLITLPKELVRYKKWEKGDTLLFTLNDKDRIEIRLKQ